jgi:hypothetical protein
MRKPMSTETKEKIRLKAIANWKKPSLKKKWLKGLALAQKSPLRISNMKRGKQHHNWKDGIRIQDYIGVKSENHPNATKDGYVAEHRLIMEKILGRLLSKKERVHHKDENKKNNNPDNLYLCANCSVHTDLHMKAYSFLIATGQVEKYLEWFEQTRM